MAGEERRMLFDVRGRRKNVIRIVYAVLALLMAGSLFLTVGPFNLGELAGTGSTKSAQEVLNEQAERIEARLAKSPDDEALLLHLARTRINAGNAEAERDPSTGALKLTPEGEDDLRAGLAAWSRYLKEVKGEPSPSGAQLIAGTYFSLAQSAVGDLSQIEEDVRGAAQAQRIVAEARPSLGSLSTLAIYEYFANDFAAGDRAAKQAGTKAGGQQKEALEKQLAGYRKRAKQWEKQRKQFLKQERKTGKEKLQNPLGGLGETSPGLTP
jgi:hypothetical protein